jgi:hypothetical protein
MMKKNFVCAAIFLILFATAGVAGAAMVDTQWTDIWTPDDGPVYFGPGPGYSTFSYEHNILDEGFIPGQDVITDYTLTIGLVDDADDGPEYAVINLPGFFSDRIFEVDFGDTIVGRSFAGLFSLNDDGILNVTVARLWGDFFLTGSTLVADGQTISHTPIPASVLFLATGLIGLLGFRRRITSS